MVELWWNLSSGELYERVKELTGVPLSGQKIIGTVHYDKKQIKRNQESIMCIIYFSYASLACLFNSIMIRGPMVLTRVVDLDSISNFFCFFTER
jgi:hypothetical protein